jgi:phytoene dehydrogenase-like protein
VTQARSSRTYDAVVVGAGPNGLVAANHLADAGWSVLLLEAQPEIGGAVHSDRELHPDYVQDTFSAFYPLGVASPALQSLHLERHGLEWSHAPAVLGHARPDAEWAMLLRDRHRTAELMEAQSPGDGEAWLELSHTWDVIGEQVVGALLTPFPPLRHGSAALVKVARGGGLGLVKELLTPAQSLGKRFSGEAPGLLLAGNAGHADIPLTSPGSGLLGMLLTFVGQQVGYPVPVGGAGELAAALARRFESLGGEIRCRTRVDHVEVERGRAVGVRTADGERIGARRAVCADVLASHLYGGLVAPGDVPRRVAREMRRFELDPGTVKVDWALDGPVPWAVPPPHAPGTVHVADSVSQMGEALGQVAAGIIPADPFMLMGQMTTSDPTRSPAGTESAWAYAHVPHGESPDAGDGGVRGVWDHDDCERFGDRMQARIERLAPGFGSRVVARRVLGPRELEARDANLVGGALNGGTSQLHQQLVFRPVPGAGRAETGIAGLYLASASAHPGGGVHGACGMNAARAALAHARLTPWRR